MKKNESKNLEQMLSVFEEKCREQSLKVTLQRIEVFKAVFNNTDHPSIEDIYTVVHKKIQSISLDTVYRTLDLFDKHGIVKKFQAPDGKFHFDTNLTDHQHLVCKKCGMIEDFTWENLNSLKVPTKSGWRGLEIANVEIHGVCSDCR